MVTEWFQDLRIAARGLAMRPGFTFVVASTLALGIGANAAIFSVVDAVLLRPLPFPEPDRLVRVWSAYPEDAETRGTSSQLDVDDWREQNDVFDAIAAYPSLRIGGYVLTGVDDPEELATTFVSPDFFETFGVPAALGRTLTAADHVEGSNHVVLLSHGSWQRRFGGAPDVVGRSLSLEEEPFTVVGVMPARFDYPSADTEIWAPLSLIPESGVPRRRFVRWLDVVARLRPGVAVAEAQAALGTIAARLADAYPDSNEGLTAVSLRPLAAVMLGGIRPALLTVFGAVGLVLLIVCANVANLMLLRSEGKAREIAVRSALGAGRLRVVRGLLVESLLLAVLGGAIGLGLAGLGLRGLLLIAPSGIPRLSSVALDAGVLGFLLLASALAGLLVGLAPALRAIAADPNASLKQGSRGSGAGAASLGAGSVLIVAEIALVLSLAVAASLLVRSYSRLTNVETGLVSENLLTMDVTAQTYKYPERSDYVSFFTRVLDRLERIPGVVSAGMVRPFPLRHDTFDGESFSFRIVGRPAVDASDAPEAALRFASPGYFRTMGIPLLSGRDFDPRDDAGGPLVAVVDRIAAERYWPGEDPVGRRIRGARGDAAGPDVTVVGVVGEVRQSSLSEEPGPAVYLTYTQVARVGMTFVVRTDGEPSAWIEHVKQAIADVDPDQPTQQIATMNEVLDEAVARPRFSMMLLGSFAVLAVVLAATGIYGVISYAVGRRTHDFGVRFALGARGVDLVGMVLREALVLTGIGILVGVGLSLAGGRLVSSLLFEIPAWDPVSYGIAVAVLGLTSLLAGLAPALRAAKMSPVRALPYE